MKKGRPRGEQTNAATRTTEHCHRSRTIGSLQAPPSSEQETDSPPPARERGSGRQWKLPGAPRKGWRCVGVEDLEDRVGECEMCGRDDIRFLHTIKHPEYPRRIEVGCVCAEKLSADPMTPRMNEKRAVSRAGRRARWLHRRWRMSRKGNPYLKAQGILVIVFTRAEAPQEGRWGYRVGEAWGERSFSTCDQAKLGAFDEFWRQRYPQDVTGTQKTVP